MGVNIKYNFPANFWWGAATSGPQTEGRFYKRHDNVFDYWFDKEPQAFFNQVGPNVTSNFFNSYKEDIQMMKSIGLNSVRTSIQWTRLIKDFETAQVDEDGLEFYNNVINEFLKAGIIPVINLHHFDLPVELYDKYGGWESKKVVDLFVLFAKKCFALFGDRVKHWITFNEPMVIVEGEYLYQFHYPKIVDGKKAVQVLYNLNLASAKVVGAFHKTKCAENGGKIGVVLNLTPSYPRSQAENDVKAANFVEDFFNRSFLDPAIKGEFSHTLVDVLKRDGVLWEATPEELTIIRNNTVDFLGVNYYQPRRAKAKEAPFDESKGWMPDKYFDDYKLPGCRMNPYRGWEIYPQAIYDIAMNIKNNYGNISWYLSENGMGVEGEEKYVQKDGSIDDQYRIDFYEEHLSWLHKAISEKANCFGFHAWTPIDCWSWSNAYKNRYGYIAVDLATQIKTIKKSGYWIKKVSQQNGF
ncbi:glycoside hydrolase family 1 protein [Pectinatus frisingensis]|uniref:glycoside hydrolase family 1 protein n=1 Tax=Pectinatus frisingensis TaxID=865 RepID=UPI003D805E44